MSAALVTTCCAVRAAAAESKLPILMYHHLSTESREVNSMTITADRFRQDMEYLKEYGFTPLLSADLVNIKSGAQPMPQRPVMITFDDGYESNYLLAYPELQKTGMKATISLITSHIRGGDYEGFLSSLTWEQAKEMYNSGLVDLGSHTHAMHNEENQGIQYDNAPNGVQRKRGEDYTAYMSRMRQDIAASVLQIKKYIGSDTPVLYFSYPFGATDSWFGQILLDNRFFVSTTTVARTANIGGGLYGLSRYRITEDLPVSKLLQHTVTAYPTITKVQVDSRNSSVATYLIDGSHYVRASDIAALLEKTEKYFSVGTQNGAMKLTSGERYERTGAEFQTFGTSAKTGKSMVSQVILNGKPTVLAAYDIGGTYFVKLRSLGDQLGFSVALDEINQILILQTT